MYVSLASKTCLSTYYIQSTKLVLHVLVLVRLVKQAYILVANIYFV